MKHKQKVGWWGNPFRLDLNSLALFRIIIGAIVSADAFHRLFDLSAHYTSNGVLALSRAEPLRDYSFSLYFLIDGWWWPALLLMLQVVVGLMLLVGYRTRLSTIFAWVLVMSLHNRNGLLLNGGDVLLHIQLFWAIFLPLNQRFSIDLVQGRVKRRDNPRIFSPATIAIVVQSVLLYAQTAALKSGNHWHETNEALYFALSDNAFATNLGTWMTQFRGLLQGSTWAAIRVETLIPIFLLSPLRPVIMKNIAFVLTIGLQFGILLLMDVGVFPWISMATAIALVPSETWQWFKRQIDKREHISKLTVYYDRSCGICQLFVRFLGVFGVTRAVTVKNIYDYKTITKKSDKYNSWVGRVDSQYLYRADVLIAILERSYIWWPLSRLLRVGWVHTIATKVYLFVSARRHSVCRPPQPARTGWQQHLLRAINKTTVFASGVAVLLLTMFCVVWVRAGTPGQDSPRVVDPYRSVMLYLGLDQKWSMFAPNPVNNNPWIVVAATTERGQEVDVWRSRWDGGKTDLRVDNPPKHFRPTFSNVRWRRYLTRIIEDNYSHHQNSFLRYACNSWNSENPTNKIDFADLVLVDEATRLDSSQETLQRYTLSRYYCD